ncbi:MAG: DNA polymerase III subunit delta' [Leptospirillia bacterium]
MSAFDNAFDNVVGHTGAIRILTTALTSSRVPHAYLFHGPAGVGKTTTAERLAAAILCTGEDMRPCGACDACGRVADGNAYDLIRIEPDGAQIKAEQVRELQGLMRSGGARGVIIITPAERLNPTAANALLKTLEEPPPGWTLILVSTRAEALLPTLRSRCQAVRFSRLPPAHTETVLARTGVEAEHCKLLSQMAQGAPGAVLNLGLSAEALADDYAEAVSTLQPDTLDSPAQILSAAETWGREEAACRRLLLWMQMWVSNALAASQGAEADALAKTTGLDPLSWSALFPPAFLAEFGGAVQEATERLDRNVNRQSTIEALLSRLRSARVTRPAREAVS